MGESGVAFALPELKVLLGRGDSRQGERRPGPRVGLGEKREVVFRQEEPCEGRWALHGLLGRNNKEEGPGGEWRERRRGETDFPLKEAGVSRPRHR